MKTFLKITLLAVVSFAVHTVYSMDIPTRSTSSSDYQHNGHTGKSYPPTISDLRPRSTSSTSKNIDVICRPAYEEDIPDLLTLFATIANDDEDKKKLVVFPEAFRCDQLTKLVQEGKLFIARKKNGKYEGDIVSFLKLFVVTPKSELEDLYAHELRCISSKDSIASLRSLCCYNVNPEDIDFIPQPLLTSDNQFLDSFDDQLDLLNDQMKNLNFDTYRAILKDQLYIPSLFDSISFMPKDTIPVVIYYGGAYTARGARGKKLGSFLLRCSFSAIRATVLSLINQYRSDKLILTYGQVLANQDNTLMKRKFVEEIIQLNSQLRNPVQSKVRLFHHAYLSCMPAFEEYAHGIKTLEDDPEREGRGNLLVYNLPSGRLSSSE